MKIFRTPGELQAWCLALKRQGKTVGLVPTMGYLHEGHLSLIDLARANADTVVVSIFVNPIQFAPNEDLAQYPRDFERDCQLCEGRKVDAVFAPADGAMYASDASTFVEETELSQNLCAKRRPTHFRGVTTVVAKLFNLTLPDVAVFGKKDAQQLRVIKRMTRDLNFPVEIIEGELIRDHDGLALSSRNRYLSASEREQALVISRCLRPARFAIERAGYTAANDVAATVKRTIEEHGGVVDYVEALDSDTLAAPTADTRKILLAVAAFFGKTRLLDNVEIDLP